MLYKLEGSGRPQMNGDFSKKPCWKQLSTQTNCSPRTLLRSRWGPQITISWINLNVSFSEPSFRCGIAFCRCWFWCPEIVSFPFLLILLTLIYWTLIFSDFAGFTKHFVQFSRLFLEKHLPDCDIILVNFFPCIKLFQSFDVLQIPHGSQRHLHQLWRESHWIRLRGRSTSIAGNIPQGLCSPEMAYFSNALSCNRLFAVKF